MIPKWEDRPVTVANLLNPAFCGEILRLVIKEYEKESVEETPIELLFLILPLVLHKRSRDSLPTTISKNFYEWLEENTITKISINNKIKDLVPYTREAILFLVYHEAIKINDNGKLKFVKYRKKSLPYIDDNEVKDIFKKSSMLGKWFSKIGSTKTIYASIGIKP